MGIIGIHVVPYGKEFLSELAFQHVGGGAKDNILFSVTMSS